MEGVELVHDSKLATRPMLLASAHMLALPDCLQASLPVVEPTHQSRQAVPAMAVAVVLATLLDKTMPLPLLSPSAASSGQTIALQHHRHIAQSSGACDLPLMNMVGATPR